MLAIPRKQRAMVRKGIKENLAEEIDPDVRRLYPLYAESVRNLGTPVIGQRYFECLKATFVDAREDVTVVKNGQPLASVLSFIFRDEALPYYGGGCRAARVHAANYFLYWDVIRGACELGRRVLAFGPTQGGTGPHA